MGHSRAPLFLRVGTHQSTLFTLIIVKETFNEKQLWSNLIGMPYVPLTTQLSSAIVSGSRDSVTFHSIKLPPEDAV